MAVNKKKKIQDDVDFFFGGVFLTLRFALRTFLRPKGVLVKGCRPWSILMLFNVNIPGCLLMYSGLEAAVLFNSDALRRVALLVKLVLDQGLLPVGTAEDREKVTAERCWEAGPFGACKDAWIA